MPEVKDSEGERVKFHVLCELNQCETPSTKENSRIYKYICPLFWSKKSCVLVISMGIIF